MAEAERSENVSVGLRLQKSDACVQLGYEINILIVRREDTHEPGVVSRYLGDVGIFAFAKLDVAVATSLGLIVNAD